MSSPTETHGDEVEASTSSSRTAQSPSLTIPKLRDFLHQLGLDEYHATFLEAGVTEDSVGEMLVFNQSELARFLDDLKMRSFHRNKFQKSLRELKTNQVESSRSDPIQTFHIIVKPRTTTTFAWDVNTNECTINDLKNKITANYPEMTEETVNARVVIFVDKESRIMVDDTDLRTTLKTFAKSGIEKFTVIFQTPQETSPQSLEEVLEKVLRGASFTSASLNQSYIMPLMHRDFSDPVQTISNNLGYLTMGSAKAMFTFLTCGGAPGIGKTRYGKELFDHLKTKWTPPRSWTQPDPERPNPPPPHFEYIILDFNNSVKLDSRDSDQSSSIILGLRLAWVFFIKRYGITFEKFRFEALKNGGLFELGPVIESIRDSLKLEDDQRLFLFVHIDEFQAIFEFKRKGTTLQESDLFKAIQRDLGTFMTGGSVGQKIFVQTFFSGTERRSIVNAKRASMYSWKLIDCPLLPLLDCVQIMRHFATQYLFDDKKWILERWIHLLLSDTGGLPRALELLFGEFFGSEHLRAQEFFDNITDHSPTAYFERVATKLDEKYCLKNFASVHKKLVIELVYRSLGSITSRRDEVLSEDDRELSLDVLESDHHLILKNINEREVLIQLPFLFLYLYNEAVKIAAGSLVGSFYPVSGTSWQYWECFLAEFEVFRNNLLVHMGQTTVLLRDIYRGAYGKDTTLNRRVKLSELNVVQIGQHFPKTKSIYDGCGQSVDWKASLVINGASAPFSDCFLFREKAESGDENLIVCLQAKLRKATTLTIEHIHEEHAKNKEAVKKHLEKDLHPITVLISTQSLREGEREKLLNLMDGCLLICWDNFPEYFGEVFTSRANLEMASQRNPNFGEPARLMQSQQMNNDLAPEIKRKRPYKSLDDLSTKVPSVKGLEEYFGFADLGDFSFYPYGGSSYTERPTKTPRRF